VHCLVHQLLCPSFPRQKGSVRQLAIPELNCDVFTPLYSPSGRGRPFVKNTADSPGINDILPDGGYPLAVNSPLKRQLPPQKSRLDLNATFQIRNPPNPGDITPFSQDKCSMSPCSLAI
jgi:hypothetical protein